MQLEGWNRRELVAFLRGTAPWPLGPWPSKAFNPPNSVPTAPVTVLGGFCGCDIGPILDPRPGRSRNVLMALALPRGLEPLFSP